jgi:8-amino-3,8-dideoxy-alpha-D-manno-octulosonate transaminase
MLGAPAQIDALMAVADKHGIPVIEDTAQACGGTFKGKRLGTFGTMGTFSFDPVKTITTGEGGMVVTNDETLYLNCAEYHDHGHDHNPELDRGLESRRFIGSNFRMGELQGAIGLAQLAKLDAIIAQQRNHKATIKDALKKVNGISFRQVPDQEGDTATFLGFFLPDGQTARAFNEVLSQENAGAIYFKDNTWHFYPKWEHLQGALTLCHTGWPFKRGAHGEDLSYPPDNLPQSETVFDRLLVYPIPIKMDDARVKTVVSAIEKAAKVVQ